MKGTRLTVNEAHHQLARSNLLEGGGIRVAMLAQVTASLLAGAGPRPQPPRPRRDGPATGTIFDRAFRIYLDLGQLLTTCRRWHAEQYGQDGALAAAFPPLRVSRFAGVGVLFHVIGGVLQPRCIVWGHCHSRTTYCGAAKRPRDCVHWLFISPYAIWLETE